MPKTIFKVKDEISPHNIRVLERTASPTVGNMLLRDIDISVDANFEAEGRDEQGNTGVWPKRKRPVRVRRKGRWAKSEKQGRLLYRTGALFKSTKAIHKAHYDGKGNWTITKGSNLAYAAIHNYGGVIHHPGTDNGFGMGIKIPPHDIPIPQREFLMVPNPELDAMAEKAARYIME